VREYAEFCAQMVERYAPRLTRQETFESVIVV